MNKNNNIFFDISLILCVVVLFIVLVINLFNNKNFLESNFYEIITLLVALIFTYYYKSRNERINRKMEYIIDTLNKIKGILEEDFWFEFEEETYSKQKLLMEHKIIQNKLDNILSAFATDFSFKSEFDYVSEGFNEYWDMVSEKIDDVNYLSSIALVLKNKLINIENKIDTIVVKLIKS